MTGTPAPEIDRTARRTNWVVGLATVGSSVTGVVGLFLGLLSVLAGEWQAAGLCLVAAGIAFGALANATLRR